MLKVLLEAKENMNRDKIELDVIVAGWSGAIPTNYPVKEYGLKGNTYIEGRIGTEYVLRVRNHYSHRVLVVPSIDGLNPLNGNPTENNNEGYVVPAYGSVTIDGWRTSLSQVSKFVFNKKTQSYSAKTGNGTANCGVLGIQIYGEKIPEIQYIPQPCLVYYPQPQPYYVYPYRPYFTEPWTTPYCGNNNTFTMTTTSEVGTKSLYGMNSNEILRSMSMSSEPTYACSLSNVQSNSVQSCLYASDETPHQIGTGWGEAKESVVSQTTFARGDLLQTLEIFYADRRGLESLGIDLSKSTKVAYSKPVAFSRFCKAPSN